MVFMFIIECCIFKSLRYTSQLHFYLNVTVFTCITPVKWIKFLLFKHRKFILKILIQIFSRTRWMYFSHCFTLQGWINLIVPPMSSLGWIKRLFSWCNWKATKIWPGWYFLFIRNYKASSKEAKMFLVTLLIWLHFLPFEFMRHC